MKSMRRLAGMYQSENVSVCEVDADKFKSFFFDFKSGEFPAFRLFTNQLVLKYDGTMERLLITTKQNVQNSASYLQKSLSSMSSQKLLRVFCILGI
jgi:hypothetical protein